jgi:hypothetical protein
MACPGLRLPDYMIFIKQQKSLEIEPQPIQESRVAFGYQVCYFILLAKTVRPDGR